MLIERDDETARIHAAINVATAGHGTCLVVVGTPGVGKTSLLDAATADAQKNGLQVLRARGTDLEREMGFAVVRDLFVPALDSTSDQDRDKVMGGAAHLAAGPLGLERGSVPVDLGSAVHGLYWLCANLAMTRPLLIAVDDAHWADLPSLVLLTHLAQHAAEHPVVLCVTMRPPAGEPAERALTALCAEATEVLRVGPLSTAGVDLLVSALLEADAERVFSAACARVSGGNPLLLTEALGELRGASIRPTADAVGLLEGFHPEVLAQTLLARIARLGPDARRVATAVAVLGHEADVRRVCLLTDLSADDVAAAVAGLRREGILSPGADLDFAHPLVRTAVYSDVAEPERSLAHGRAARILADEGHPDRGRIATQLLPATPQGDPWVVALLRGAAGDALADGAPTSAATYLERALAEPPPPEDRVGLQFDLGRAHARSGQIETASAAFHAALDAEPDPVRRATIAIELGRSLRLAGHVPGAISLLDRAVTDLPPGHDELALTLETEIGIAGHMGLPASGWVDRLLNVARRATGPSLPERTLRGFQAYVSASTGGSTAAEVAHLALSSIRPDEDVDPSILQGVAAALAMSGRFADATRILDRSAAIAQELGNANQFAFVMSTRTWVATRAGRIRDGEADARALLAIPGVSLPYIAYAVGHVVITLVERDALSEARELLVEHDLDRVPSFDGLAGAIAHLARGRLARVTGQPQEALLDVESCRQALEAFGLTGPAFGEWREEAALTYLAAGSRDRALTMADEDVKLSRAYGGARELGIALRTRGLVDGGPAGLEQLQEAVDVLRGSEAVLDLAKAQVELGAALRRTGRRIEAREHLGAGLDLASSCGASAVAARARSELTAAGARPRRERLTGPEALTASELRVARLAVEGLSNPEIAQSLFVTRRTVEVHLTHAYRKLGIESRSALRSALADDRSDAPSAAGDVAGGTQRQPSRHPMS